jgi:type IV pilus assembly protein PilW
MRSRLPSAKRRAAGFTLIELMIGLGIGLLASLAVTHVLVNHEGQKRATTSGSDANVNGALALSTVQRTVQSAGYGFAAAPGVIYCPLKAKYNGVAPVGFPDRLVPVTITNGASDAPDTIRVLASGKGSFAIPTALAGTYNPATTGTKLIFPAITNVGFEGQALDASGIVTGAGDLVVAATDAGVDCEMFEVTGKGKPADTNIPRADAASRWNATGFPAGIYNAGALLLNMGRPVDVAYSVVNNSLRMKALHIDAATGAPSYDASPVELFPDIVQLQALYGKDTNADGKIDQWDNATPTTNAGWRQIVAVRVALLARSSQYERDEVTTANPQWDLGTAASAPDATTCGSSKCLKLKIDSLDDWKHYRYRVFETVIPLRNMLWNS